jgi:hypothetical protein
LHGNAAALHSSRGFLIMSDSTNKTIQTPVEFDFSDYPANTLFHERRCGKERRMPDDVETGSQSEGKSLHPPARERRQRKERRRRIDPTTYEKQYTEEELAFMNAMQRFKERTGKVFPTHGEVIQVAVGLGYRKQVMDDDAPRLISAPGLLRRADAE